MDAHKGIYPSYSLLQDKHIRLLHLEPATDSDAPIRCSFTTVSLANSPCYEALSYVWGDSTLLNTVKLDGFDVAISRNLFQALCRLRRRDADRILWVDAVCINQGDIDERSRQVSLMGSIYQGAERVVVFLGQEWDGQDLAFDYLNLCAEQSEYHFVPSLEPHLKVSMNRRPDNSPNCVQEHGLIEASLCSPEALNLTLFFSPRRLASHHGVILTERRYKVTMRRHQFSETISSDSSTLPGSIESGQSRSTCCQRLSYSNTATPSLMASASKMHFVISENTQQWRAAECMRTSLTTAQRMAPTYSSHYAAWMISTA